MYYLYGDNVIINTSERILTWDSVEEPSERHVSETHPPEWNDRNVRFDHKISELALEIPMAIVPSKAWEGRMRCKDAALKPFVGTLRVESPSGSA